MILTPEQSLQRTIEMAKIKGVVAEALVVHSRDFSASYHNQIINSYDVSKTCSLGVRIVDGEHEGLAFTESFEREDIESTFEEAINNKKYVVKNLLQELPSTDSILDHKQFFNEKLAKVPVEEKLDFAKRLESSAKSFDPRVHSLPYNAYGDNETQVWLYNTKGTQSSYTTNSCFAYAYPLCVDGDKRGMAFSAEVSRDFAELNVDRIIKKGVENSLLKLLDQKPKSGMYSTLIKSKAAQTLISLIVKHLSLQNVDQNLSALANRLGESLFSEKLHIVDDPLYIEGMGSRPFDAEGTRSEAVDIVKEGVLKTYLTNYNYAKKYKLRNTGHASRSPHAGMSIRSSNLRIAHGNLSFEELVNLDTEVLVIDNLKGLAGVNPISGDFSIESEGFLYKRGEFSHAVSHFTLSGNVFNCLKNIIELGDDFEPSLNNIYTPSLFVGKMSVAGA